MPTQPHHFTVGRIECVAVEDGTNAFPSEVLFHGTPTDSLTESLSEHGLEADRIPVSFTCLLVDTGQRRLLIDTGLGRKSATGGHLPSGLAAAGVSPPDVDVVVLTHGHPDHVGGNVDAEG